HVMHGFGLFIFILFVVFSAIRSKDAEKKHSPKLNYNYLILWIEACFLRKSKKHAKFAINSLNIQH
ncbi:hypothetical protein, partial [Escherichia coli]